ncbi:CARDB domain-containing protein [Geotalea uraniireducens]|uniref:40-residue YVTN family beta-propeller repeat protein n=1 Tax=Geotalea uraniireducens (strain Rf4) TaxID=351605 RepID=A5G878_GEOUR|nr:CARDB domain-containing protein [Geotalea uraniireducens]ABQ27996.1 40-residue YVTN family beta-propeller repeat protein [Geotalea uraniireducens Rf4]
MGYHWGNLKKLPLQLLTIILLIVSLTVAAGSIAQPACAAMSSVTWTTQPDFENNASTTNTPTTRVNIDTTTVSGDVKIGIPKDLLSTATIINNTSNNKVYTIGAERNSVAVINATTKELLPSIPLPAQPSGAVYNSVNNKLYVGYYNDNKVSVIDCVTDTVIATVTVGNGANAALYNPTNNKVYIANMTDQTVSVLDGISDTVIATVQVIAGPYTASYNLATNKVYLTNKFNNVVSVIDGASNQVEKSLEIEPVVSMLSGLRVTGVAPFDKAHLSWNYDELTTGQKIQFQVRTAQDLTSLESAQYLGPDGSADTWYDLTTSGATTVDGPVVNGIQTKTTSIDLNIQYAHVAELRLKLSSSDMTTPVLHAVTLAYESYTDLEITDVSGPATGVIGNSVTISTTAFNKGTDSATAFKIGIYLDDLKGTSCYLGERTVTSLAPKTPDTGSITVIIPTACKTGDYYLKAIADYTNLVVEGDETNNTKLGNNITISSVQPDLVVKNVSGTVSGGKLTYSVTIQNRGINAAGNYAFPTAIYISSDAAITTSDYLIDANYAHIPGNSEVILTGTRSVPPNLPPGNYYIGAYADYTNQVPEFDETNNSLAGNQPYINNDLIVTAVSGTVANGKVTYSVTVKNVGNGVAGNYAFPTAIYISSDAAITTSDYLIDANYAHIPGNSEVILTGTRSVPPNLPPGNYYIGAYADYTNQVPESDETNNSLAGNQPYINNDLIVTAVSGTVANGKVTYSVTVKNVGNGVAGNYAFPTAIYISSDAAITTSDYLIDANWTNIPGNSEVVLTGTRSVPPNLPPGNYYIGAYADYTNQVPESDETNNSLAGNQPYINNDLIVTAVSGTVANGKVTYSVTVKNVGNGVAGNYAFPTAIYISSDAAITTSDYLIDANWANIPGNSEVVLTGTRSVPPNLPPGNYYIGAYADYTNQVPESDETNNSLAGNPVIM